MTKLILIILPMLILFSLSIAEESQQIFKARDSMMVTTTWLSENLGDPSVLIFHVGMPDGYEKGHIPGAHLFPMREIFKPPTSGLNHEMPPIAKLDSLFKSIGVRNDSRIVLYHGENPSCWMVDLCSG
jgi:3-mercaptopyruvate sulfurtransferase SseA